MLHKQTLLGIGQTHFDRYGNERDSFLESSLVTKHGPIIASRRVNSWVWYRNVQIRAAWQIFKNQPFAGKLMRTDFWDSQGPVPEHYQERCTTINTAHYSEMLTDWLKPAIPCKRRRLLLKYIVLLHGNAAHTAETLR
jgi:hypothetical protein